MQLVCSAETKADDLFLSGKLSEADALQARVLMGDLDIDVVCFTFTFSVACFGLKCCIRPNWEDSGI